MDFFTGRVGRTAPGESRLGRYAVGRLTEDGLPYLNYIDKKTPGACARGFVWADSKNKLLLRADLDVAADLRHAVGVEGEGDRTADLGRVLRVALERDFAVVRLHVEIERG